MMTNWPAMRIGCLILASAALTTSSSFAQTQEPAGAGATASVISSVAITQASQRASVRVEGAGPHGTAGHPTNTRKILAPRFALPGELTQPSVVLASFGGRSEPARPTPQQAAQQQSGNAAATVGNSQASVSTSSARYTGEPISVNLKDVDLKDFFRLIHEISGLNVVLDPAVKGSWTIVLDEVPWDQALDIVLQT